MSVIKPRAFPFRLPAARLPGLHESVAAAFEARDYLYVARFGHREPELRGCALLLLGNRAGGERVLNDNAVQTGRSFFYRAYAAWREDERANAQQELAKARAAGFDAGKCDRLDALMKRDKFRIVYKCDFRPETPDPAFKDLPGFDVTTVSHFKEEHNRIIPLGQSLASVVPPGAPVDLVLLDNAKWMPAGTRDLGAPVAAHANDIEWDYNYYDKILPDIDLLHICTSSKHVEVARGFDVESTQYYYLPRTEYAPFTTMQDAFAGGAKRPLDLVITGVAFHDFYRYKLKEIMGLLLLDPRYKIQLIDGFIPFDKFWDVLHGARFTIGSGRASNCLFPRAFESLTSGALHIVEEENAAPFAFSQSLACFPSFGHESAPEDVARILSSYDAIMEEFTPQLPQFDREVKSYLKNSAQTRVLHYLRHLLFTLYVEMDWDNHPNRARRSTRDMVYMCTMGGHAHHPTLCPDFIEQTKPDDGLRKLIACYEAMHARNHADPVSMQRFNDLLPRVFAANPRSLALHFTVGAWLHELDALDAADGYYDKCLSGDLELHFNDPVPASASLLHSFYWITDARIRARCAKDDEPLVAPETVIASYCNSNRGHIRLKKAQTALVEGRRDEGLALLRDAVAFLERAAALFPHNDSAEKIYLTTAFEFTRQDEPGWGERFLTAFATACANDWSILPLFGSKAIGVLRLNGREAEAARLERDIRLYESRMAKI